MGHENTMYLMLTLGGLAFVLSLVFTPLVRNVFHKYGILDQPDTTRKMHLVPVPRVGGISIVLAYVTTFFIILLEPMAVFGSVVQESLSQVLSLLPAIAVIFATGLLDDILGLKPWQKLLGQLCAAGLAVSAGVQINVFADQPLSALWTNVASVLWLLICTNAFNLIDGLDGLAAGIGMVSTMTVLVAALIFNDIGLAVMTAPLVGCLFGFLRYNFSPASVFLGDCGSLLIGFLLGTFGVLWSHKSTTVIAMTAPIMAMSIPLLDVGLSIMRRFLRKQPILRGDRGHIHHRLLDHGITPRRVAVLMYLCCLCAAGFSLLQLFAHRRAGAVIMLLFCAAVWAGMRQLKYVEFDLARELLFKGTLRNLIDGRTRLLQIEKRLVAAKNVEECWKVISEVAPGFGFTGARFHADNTVYTVLNQAWRDESSWLIRVPLTDSHYIELRRSLQEPTGAAIVPAFISMARMAMREKLLVPEFASSKEGGDRLDKFAAMTGKAGRPAARTDMTHAQ